MNEQTLAKKVKDALAQPVDKSLWHSLWGNLKRRGFIDTEEYKVEEIIEEAQTLEKEFQASFAPRPSLGPGHSVQYERTTTQKNKELFIRQEVLSEIHAKEASDDEEVTAFRKKVLDGKLLNLDEVAPWMRQQAQIEARDYPPSVFQEFYYEIESFVKFQVVDNTEDLLEGIEFVKAVKAKFDRSVPEVWDKISVVIGGTLDDLYCLGKSLSGRYGWEVSNAGLFILTDIMPLVPLIKVRNHSIGYRSQATRRITLEIDPTLTDKQVARVYRKARRRLLKTDAIGRAVYRPLSEKHLKLAQFGVRQPEDRAASRRLQLWNMKHEEEWGYSDSCAAGNLNRDCKKAVERLLNP
jgi:hypothetical protein